MRLTVLQSIISTALPTIVHDLNGSDFIWAGSAYIITATAFTPLTGGPWLRAEGKRLKNEDIPLGDERLHG